MGVFDMQTFYTIFMRMLGVFLVGCGLLYLGYLYGYFRGYVDQNMVATRPQAATTARPSSAPVISRLVLSYTRFRRTDLPEDLRMVRDIPLGVTFSYPTKFEGFYIQSDDPHLGGRGYFYTDKNPRNKKQVEELIACYHDVETGLCHEGSFSPLDVSFYTSSEVRMEDYCIKEVLDAAQRKAVYSCLGTSISGLVQYRYAVELARKDGTFLYLDVSVADDFYKVASLISTLFETLREI